MQECISVKVNGVGNAWPVKIGQSHKFYSTQNHFDLSNASFSIVSSNSKNIQKNNINWEILIDAGHGTIQYLINSYNRIPDAIVLTHPHIDHILGLDWLVQSYFRVYKKNYPVYASKLCWKQTLQVFPHLDKMVEYCELIPGEPNYLKEAENMELRSFPVFHGESAHGSHMLAFKVPCDNGNFKKVIITGDLLCPLLREMDLDFLKNTDFVIVDSNNRYPYPKCNHWSITGNLPKLYKGENFLVKELKLNQLSYLISSHLKTGLDYKTYLYFDAFIKDMQTDKLLFYNVFDFVHTINARNTLLIHYSGSEDEKYYNEQILSKIDLAMWSKQEAQKQNITSDILVPGSGDIYPLNFN